MNDEAKAAGCVGTVLIGLLGVGVSLGMYGCPQYRVYEQRMAGEAEKAKAESSKQVQIADAQAKESAAKMLAGAEIERAKGVAESIRITGEALEKNPHYLTLEWIRQVNADGNSVIYVPTEAGLPILEATRGLPKAEPKKTGDK